MTEIDPGEVLETTECSVGRDEPGCLKKDEEEKIKEVAVELRIIDPKADMSKSLNALLNQSGFGGRIKSVKDLIDVLCEKSVGTPLEKEVNRIREIAFKPNGPADNQVMMDSFLLIRLGMQLQENFKGVEFGGVLTYDFMITPVTSVYGDPKEVYRSYVTKKWDRLQFVLNTDHRMGVGRHWVALIINTQEHQIQYADSFGDPPLSGLLESSRPYPEVTDPNGMFLTLLRTWIIQVQNEFISHGVTMARAYTDIQTQSETDQINCGVYAMLTLALSAKGYDFRTANSQQINTRKIREVRGLLFEKISDYNPVYPRVTPDSMS